tara:strand:- start:109 stop:390 length:282 start_codon:yes stop_codon:yes gene_type:complete
MKLLRTLWNWVIRKTSRSPKLALVEQPSKKCGDEFRRICSAHGIGEKLLNSVNAAELFEEWYDGSCDEGSILAAVQEFKKQHPAVNAKLNGKL